MHKVCDPNKLNIFFFKLTPELTERHFKNIEQQRLFFDFLKVRY